VASRTGCDPDDVRAVPFVGSDGKGAGVRVTGIKRGSPLAALGVKPGDVLRTVDATAIEDLRTLLAVLATTAPRGVEVQDARDGTRRALGTLGPR
jgi:S1-C subfamily serine protease